MSRALPDQESRTGARSAAIRGPASLEMVERALRSDLPGVAAQTRMLPAYRAMRAERGPDAPPWREAAVLVLLYPEAGRLVFPLTLRTEDTAHHKGQISLPGGSREEDESLEAAALRETEEEIGVPASSVEIMGRLSVLEVSRSNFLISPFIGRIDARPDFRLESMEVAELIEAPLDLLLDPSASRSEMREFEGKVWNIPYFEVGGHKVWGATGMILAELAYILEREFSGSC